MLILVARNPTRIGRYELVTALATGGMGRIYLARATGIGGFERKVVIKTLETPLTAESDPAIAMFLDEARLLGLLHHQHIASVFEVGRDDDGRHFMVLDYVDGYSGHDVGERALQYGATLPLDFTLTVLSAAANGLHYTHTRKEADGTPLGIVHRDVTPSNVMIGYDGAVKLIDFGIAMAVHRTTKTQTGFVKGKVGYLSPEQVSGREVDPRTDVFALGILLYELSTLHRAFRESSDLATMQRIKAGKFTRPSQIITGYPPELEAIVVKALQVEPRDRFNDADAMRRAVEALGHRMRLVLGDAAIIEVMGQLFEPNARAVSSPASRASDPSFEWAASDHDLTIRREPEELLALLRRETELAASSGNSGMRTAPRKLRAATEAADALNIEDAAGSASLTQSIGAAESASLTQAMGAAESASLTRMMGEAAPVEPFVAAVPPVEPVVRFNAPLIPPGPLPLPPSLGPPAPLVDPSVRGSTGTDVHNALVGAGLVRAHGDRRWSVRWIAAVVALVVLGSIAYMMLRRSPRSAEKSVVAPAVPAAARASQPAPPPPRPAHAEPAPVPAKVRIQIVTRPADATVLLDGKRLGHTPLDETVDADAGPHVIKLRKLRYDSQLLEVTLDKDITQDITLVRDR